MFITFNVMFYNIQLYNIQVYNTCFITFKNMVFIKMRYVKKRQKSCFLGPKLDPQKGSKNRQKRGFWKFLEKVPISRPYFWSNRESQKVLFLTKSGFVMYSTQTRFFIHVKKHEILMYL